MVRRSLSREHHRRRVETGGLGRSTGDGGRRALAYAHLACICSTACETTMLGWVNVSCSHSSGNVQTHCHRHRAGPGRAPRSPALASDASSGPVIGLQYRRLGHASLRCRRPTVDEARQDVCTVTMAKTTSRLIYRQSRRPQARARAGHADASWICAARSASPLLCRPGRRLNQSCMVMSSLSWLRSRIIAIC